ncbi:MAG: hypothetical protein AAGA20_05005 [Planctomycetota bacterium]
MSFKTSFLTATISVAVAGVAYGQDECATATAAVGGGVPTAFDTSTATTSPEAWPCALGGSDIWFTYTPTTSGGSVTVSLCGSTYDTAVEGFSGTCGSLTSLGCNDDSCGLQSELQFGPTAAGTPLYFRIGGFNGANGTGTYTVTENPPGMGADECSGAVALTSGAAVAFDTASSTTSAPGWACALGGGPDLWYSYTTTIANGLLSVETCGSSYDTALEIFEGTCGGLTLLQCNDDFCGLQSGVSTLTGAAGTTYFIRVGGFNGSAGAGTILANETASPCNGPDDSFEPNDTCPTASVIAPGSYTGLFASTTAPDFYEITLQPFDQLTVTVVDTLNEDLDLNTFDGACALDTFFNTDGFTVTNFTGAPQVLRYEVFLDPGFSGVGCLNYDMDVIVATDPCSTFMDDGFEPNDDCSSATGLGDGTYPGLGILGTNNDHFAVGVDAGATLDVGISFIDANMDMDLYLWDPNVICGTDIAGEGIGVGELAVGFSASDDETISYTNNTGSAQSLIVEVTRFDLDTNGCSNYDLVISGSNGMGGGGLGMRYCMANANSTGNAAQISAAGSALVSDNDVTLTTTDMPTFAFAFYLASTVQGFVPNPGGSDGNLCLAGQIGRYVGPGQIQNSGAAGEVSLVINLDIIPSPMGPVMAMPGETWNFSTWFRDTNMSGTTSNFSDGVSIMFN